MLLAALVLAASACVPITPLRRSAFVPRPVAPSQGGAPIGEKGVKAAVQLNTAALGGVGTESKSGLLQLGPEVGAPGLFIPELQIGGFAYAALNPYLEIGGQVHYSRLEWAEPNVRGVPNFPPDREDLDLWMGGPGFRVNLPIEDSLFTPAFVAEANFVSVQEAVFLCVERCDGYRIGEEGEVVGPVYDFDHYDDQLFILPSAHLHLTMSPLPWLHPFAMVGLQRNVENVGFEPDIETIDDPSATGYWHGDAAIGAEVRVEPVFMTGTLLLPFAMPDYIDPGVSASVQLGVVL